MNAEQVQALHQAIQMRPRSEDVADLVLQILDLSLTVGGRQMLEYAARRSLRRQAIAYTSMAQDFDRPATGVARQIRVAHWLFELPSSSLTETCPSPAASIDADRVLEFVRDVGAAVGKVVGKNDFRTDRWATKRERREHAILKNARWYNKRWRVLRAIEVKLARLAWNQRKYEATRVGKSALATSLTVADIGADANTSCFVAYLSARMSLRSTFTNTSQVRAFDVIASMLFDRCKGSDTTRWDVIASVYPVPVVLRRLSDAQKGVLLGKWWSRLRDIASMLEAICAKLGRLDVRTMVVSRSQDSSSWNQVAGGWNVARSHWLSLLEDMGFESFLDRACPGKVMRLMAADVARWHTASGGTLHPDTKVWAALPKPWEVIDGRATCTRDMVRRACAHAGVDPDSWVQGKRAAEAVEFSPTPELVHGVAVTSPELAAILRRAGAFSGKPLRAAVPDGVEVLRDQTGAALAAGYRVADPPCTEDAESEWGNRL